MDCHRLDPLVTPYVDDQLPEADRTAVDQHLRRCPPCHSRVAAEQAVRTLIHDHKGSLERACAPQALRTRCAAYARMRAIADVSRDPAGNIVWTARWAPLTLAASLVMLVGSAFLYQLTTTSSRVMAAELAADHVKCFAMNGVLRTADTVAEVERQMHEKFGWDMHLPANSDTAGLELVGARPCLYGEGKVAHIMYRHNGEPVSVFMLPKTERPAEMLKVLGYEATVWCANDRTFVLLAHEPRPEVDRIATFVQASLH